ncbi:unnamed protein product [Peniophora sp. CBMAI 1063]|nr:unnamed protein product [Peniophora sp. CBMAI 1063]
MSSNPRWIPLESNPDVMNSWAYKAGLLPSSAEFTDVYGLDDELLALVPQPVHAVVLLFPIDDALESVKKQEDEKTYEVDPTVFWMKQTIGNACGTMGLIHALANTEVAFEPDCPMQRFLDVCKEKSPLDRAKILETTDIFANIHAEAAAGGQTAAPSADEKVDLHFTCFVKAPTVVERATQAPAGEYRLIELDGRRSGPVDRGECTDLLKDAARYIRENIVPKMDSMQLGMIALAGHDDDD